MLPDSPPIRKLEVNGCGRRGPQLAAAYHRFPMTAPQREIADLYAELMSLLGFCELYGGFNKLPAGTGLPGRSG
jgi:hypothetical protein